MWSLCCTVGLCRFVAPKAASFALRRAGCCVDAGPAGRCGRFSCFAHAPLIKKSGQKRNHGLLWPALPSGWSVSGARASAALRAVSVGGRGKKLSFGCVGKVLGMDLGVGLRCGVKFPVVLPRRAAPCSVTGTGAAGCCKVHTSEVSLPAAPCAPLCGARGAAPVLRTPPRLREPRPFFWAAFLSLRRLRCGKKSRGSGLLTAAFVILNAAPLEKIRVPGFFSGYFSLPAAIRRERKVPAAPRGSRDNAANRAA